MLQEKRAKKSLLSELKTYCAFDDAEKIELERLVNFLENNTNVYSRENLTGHLTSSCWIVNKDRSKALLVHHNIYNCWAPLGGHADNEANLPSIALKEAQEESGIQNVTLVDEKVLDIATFTVPEHMKRGKFIPLHFHFDLRYLLEADENEDLVIAEREVSDARWFTLDEISKLNIDIMPIIKRVLKKVRA